MTTKSHLTVIRTDESVPDDVFRDLMLRFVLATERLTLALHALNRCEDYGPATCVVEEATEALVQIRREFGRFEMHHEFIAKEVQS